MKHVLSANTNMNYIASTDISASITCYNINKYEITVCKQSKTKIDILIQAVIHEQFGEMFAQLCLCNSRSLEYGTRLFPSLIFGFNMACILGAAFANV